MPRHQIQHGAPRVDGSAGLRIVGLRTASGWI
jgi:hypothetical protein